MMTETSEGETYLIDEYAPVEMTDYGVQSFAQQFLAANPPDPIELAALLADCYEERAVPRELKIGSTAKSEEWDTYRLGYDADGKNMRYEKEDKHDN